MSININFDRSLSGTSLVNWPADAKKDFMEIVIRNHEIPRKPDWHKVSQATSRLWDHVKCEIQWKNLIRASFINSGRAEWTQDAFTVFQLTIEMSIKQSKIAGITQGMWKNTFSKMYDLLAFNNDIPQPIYFKKWAILSTQLRLCQFDFSPYAEEMELPIQEWSPQVRNYFIRLVIDYQSSGNLPDWNQITAQLNISTMDAQVCKEKWEAFNHYCFNDTPEKAEKVEWKPLFFDMLQIFIEKWNGECLKIVLNGWKPLSDQLNKLTGQQITTDRYKQEWNKRLSRVEALPILDLIDFNRLFSSKLTKELQTQPIDLTSSPLPPMVTPIFQTRKRRLEDESQKGFPPVSRSPINSTSMISLPQELVKLLKAQKKEEEKEEEIPSFEDENTLPWIEKQLDELGEELDPFSKVNEFLNEDE